VSLSYTVRESLSSFTRTKLSSLLSIITISISVLLLGLFGVLSLHAARFLEELRARVELEAFLDEPVTRREVDSLRTAITALDGVEHVAYVSKSEAAAIFRKEFGEGILDVFDFNPLPPSLKITLKEGYRTAVHAHRLEEQIKALPKVESVEYRKALLDVIDERAKTVHNITLGLGILVGLSAIVLVSNTIRLAISAKRQIIRTMELVGATRWFIRQPFLLEGFLQGLLGGMLAATVLYAILVHALPFVSLDLATFIQVQPEYYATVIALGVVLGLIGSSISVLWFIRRPGR
jgi:cell division transport system permease protein